MRLFSIATAIIMLLFGVDLSSRLAIAASVSDGGMASSSYGAAGVCWRHGYGGASCKCRKRDWQLARITLGLEFRMTPGWKICWRPGETGLAPKIDLTLVDGTPLTPELDWPVPEHLTRWL